MEHPAALEMGKGLYPWHSGAPDDRSYAKDSTNIGRINATSLADFGAYLAYPQRYA
ncbi:MAG: hypothetical protein U0X92_12030 [Anaerolineales bacterium]